MSIVLLLARVLLAAVFAVAALAKLADRSGSRQAVIDFGVPAPLATPLGIVLPLAELAVAVALLLPASAWWGALGALTLLLLFIVGIGYNLARGRRPDCHCFGQLHSAPVGWSTLIRNLGLSAIAGVIISFGRANPGPSPLDWLAGLTMVQRFELLFGVVVLILLAVLGWLLLQVLQQQGRLLIRIEALEAQRAAQGLAPQQNTGGLPLGSRAPTFTLPDLNGAWFTLETLRAAGKPVVLVFSDPGCGPCTALLPEIGRWQREYAGKLTLALISRGTPEDNRSKTSEHGITRVLVQEDREVAQAYQAHGTPSAVLVRPDGTMGSALAAGAEGIRALVAGAAGLPVLRVLPTRARANGNGHAATEEPRVPAGPQIGEPAPQFSLPDLTGKTRNLTDFQGSKTLVLFWNPGCGFCQRMLSDVQAWEAKPPKGAPRLLVISTGTVEANQALGLHSPVLLDEGLNVGSGFGANGTPMAVLIDTEGKIASEVAAGAQAVFALASQKQDKATHV